MRLCFNDEMKHLRYLASHSKSGTVSGTDEEDVKAGRPGHHDRLSEERIAGGRTY
jgi:hypothetical protein